MAAPAQYRSQVISRSGNPQARSLGVRSVARIFSGVHFVPRKVDDLSFLVVALKTQAANAADCFTVKIPRVVPGCVLCTRIDPLRFLAGCCRRRLNQGLVVRFFSLLDRACFCVILFGYGCMLCLVRYLFVISTSVIDCLGRFVPEMTILCVEWDVKPY